MNEPANTEVIQRINGKFAPGVSGNPAGKPPGARHLTSKLWDMLEKVALDKNGEPDKTQRTYADKLIERILIEGISKGNPAIIKLIMDRIDGAMLEGYVNNTLNIQNNIITGDIDIDEIAKRVGEEIKKRKREQ